MHYVWCVCVCERDSDIVIQRVLLLNGFGICTVGCMVSITSLDVESIIFWFRNSSMVPTCPKVCPGSTKTNVGPTQLVVRPKPGFRDFSRRQSPWCSSTFALRQPALGSRECDQCDVCQLLPKKGSTSTGLFKSYILS